MRHIKTKISWIGLIGGVTTIALAVISIFNPWWQIAVGENFANAKVSPLNTNFDFLGNTLTIPLMWALNLTCLLSLVSSGIAILVYSIIPTKRYSKHLLSFAYKKPFFTLLLFVIVLFAITQIVNSIFSLNVPMVGSATVTLPEAMTYNATVNVLISAQFQWAFWLATVTAGLCLATRLYHNRIVPAQASAT